MGGCTKSVEFFEKFQTAFDLSPSFSENYMRALGLLLADGAPTVGWGKTFRRVGRVYFCENHHISETNSRKINFMVRNDPSLRGLQTGQIVNVGPTKFRRSKIKRTYNREVTQA